MCVDEYYPRSCEHVCVKRIATTETLCWSEVCIKGSSLVRVVRHSDLNIDIGVDCGECGNALHHLSWRVDVDNPFVDAKLKLVPSLRTFTTRGLAGSDAKFLDGHPDRSLNNQVLPLGRLDERGAHCKSLSSQVHFSHAQMHSHKDKSKFSALFKQAARLQDALEVYMCSLRHFDRQVEQKQEEGAGGTYLSRRPSSL